MVSIGVSPARHGVLLAGWRAVIIATYLLMHRCAFWQFRLRTALGSQILGACGLATIACANSAGMLAIGLALLGQLVGYNYFAGLYYSTAGSKHERRSLAAGIHEATLATGMALGSFVGGQLGAHVGQGTPYLLACAVMLGLMLVQYAAWSRLRRDL
jgi:predicted MFS family arabinose efflux permease